MPLSNTPSRSKIDEILDKILIDAFEQAQNLKDRRASAYALGYRGAVYQQRGDLPKAEEFTRQALSLTSSIKAPDIAYRWQWQLGRLRRTEGDPNGAIAAYTSAFKNLQSLRGDLVSINPEVQFNFRDGVEPVYRELVDLLLQGEEPSQINLKQARETIEALQLAELDNFFREACVNAKPQQIDLLVDSSQPLTAVFYAIFLKNRLEIIVKLPGKDKPLQHYTTFVSQEKAESILRELQQALPQVDRAKDVRNLSQQVYQWLIQPAEAELAKSNVKTLVFVLDGLLRNIPMAVLYNGKQYLIEKYAVALTPGLQLLTPRSLAQIKLNALTAGISEELEIEGKEFSKLENVESELKGVQSSVSSSDELVNQKFTNSEFQNKLNEATFSIVHLATHGQFSSNPEETFILLWDRLLKVRDLDNLVRISNQSGRRNIELLVLSACQTAEGDNRAVLGLAGVAVRAGARSTLATLWPVDDPFTTFFMSQFYQQLTKPNVTKAEALQRAQISLLAKEKRPYFWAPYTLVGNWL
ncbi:CHAT domain-containing protein [Microseira wollei]|uniref:Tetratricopeptide region n=1 Tax=Microseira wollei NIES-4236 TaxID=2530354 RepID=A0AAV3XGW2_9CYAN|nr:CHAT domain-containing protein [Microseira wollei]GET39971.1 tetratricopeptide region [Microseira wollei NIES-4236]